jgi:hypothetical protein
MTERYLEDFVAGQRFGGTGRIRIEKERITGFATEFDPQPFHLDEQAARGSIFGGLAASGWHTAAVTMRLLVESDLSPQAASSAQADGSTATGAAATSCARGRGAQCARQIAADQGVIKVHDDVEPARRAVGRSAISSSRAGRKPTVEPVR